jgi:hypothetical protein
MSHERQEGIGVQPARADCHFHKEGCVRIHA